MKEIKYYIVKVSGSWILVSDEKIITDDLFYSIHTFGNRILKNDVKHVPLIGDKKLTYQQPILTSLSEEEQIKIGLLMSRNYLLRCIENLEMVSMG